MKSKIENIINFLSNNLQERDDAIRLSVLALLSGESIFLLGPPGVAKSLVSRKIKTVIKDSKNFEYLMNRFSTPDDIFGPISLKKLEEDKYERKIDGYLPDSEIAFLDEIWKASPSIQNTLLTIINEKLYRNGTEDIKVPLLLLIAASNELPVSGEGLEALYDRFIIRLYVDNIGDKESFKKMINTNIESDEIGRLDKLTIDEIKKIRNEVQKLEVDEETLEFIINLRQSINGELKENAPYISDRRWKKIASILKTCSFLNNEKRISPMNWLIVRHMVWETQEQQKQLNNIIFETWANTIMQQKSDMSFKETEEIVNNLPIDIKEVEEPKIFMLDMKKYYAFSNDNINDVYFIEKSLFDKKNNHFKNPNNYIDMYYTSRSNLTSSKVQNFSRINIYSNNININNNVLTYHNNDYYLITKKEKKVSYSDEVPRILDDFFLCVTRMNQKRDDIISELKNNKNIFESNNDFFIEKISVFIDEKIKSLLSKRDEILMEINNLK